MKKNRAIFYIIFALFHLGAFVFTVKLGNDRAFLLSVYDWVAYFKWATLLGVVLVAIDLIWTLVSIKEHGREKAALVHEVNALKAKLFDMQEAKTKRDTDQGPTSPPPSAH